jgi:hypothetical protein
VKSNVTKTVTEKATTYTINAKEVAGTFNVGMSPAKVSFSIKAEDDVIFYHLPKGTDIIVTVYVVEAAQQTALPTEPEEETKDSEAAE